MKKVWAAVAILIISCLISGCGKEEKKGKLDPKNPVMISVWHYYNGSQQVAFDELVEEFNNTVGKEEGIYVEGHSQGDVAQLEETVRASLKNEVGSEEAPNIFSSYADTAYEIEQMGALADISQYMTEKELEEYVDSYIEEGRIRKGGALKIFPVAKSSEVMLLNQTDWDKFAEETGAKLEDLSTKEGIVKTAEAYYNWTDAKTPDVPNDGKAFYGRDAMANLFIIGSMQLGTELFQVEGGKVTLNVEKEIMKKIWDFYYVPYVKGYFKAYGRFRSDDVKIGEIISFTGSTTSSMYFPDEVELENESYPIACTVMQDPVFENGEKYAVQQGAGMVVTKQTEEEEYASVVFLKWFAQAENNIKFGCESGYLPVKKEAVNKETLDRVIQENQLSVTQKTYDSLVASFSTVKDYTMYTNKAFDGGSAARKVLEYHLSDKAAADREAVVKSLEEGNSLEEAVAPYISQEAFEAWLKDFTEALTAAVQGKQ